jgi:hypothetical protein
MAKTYTGVTQSKIPVYDRTSKMRNYDIMFDPEVNQNRTGFYRASNFKGYVATGSDIVWEVEAGYEHRTDLISLKFYQSSIYDWIIEDANNIEHPIKDVKVGTKLIIPDKNKIYSSGVA